MWPTRSPQPFFAPDRARVCGALGRRERVLSRGVREQELPGQSILFEPTATFCIWWAARFPEAALLLAEPEPKLYVPPPDRADGALWHGPSPSMDELGRRARHPACGRFRSSATGLRIIRRGSRHGVAERRRNRHLAVALLGRTSQGAPAGPALRRDGRRTLAEALIALRIAHDERAVSQMRQVAAATAIAHRAGMRATRHGIREAEVAAAMVAAPFARAWARRTSPSSPCTAKCCTQRPTTT